MITHKQVQKFLANPAGIDLEFWVCNCYLTTHNQISPNKLPLPDGFKFKKYGEFGTVEDATVCQRDYPGSFITGVFGGIDRCWLFHVHNPTDVNAEIEEHERQIAMLKAIE